MVCLGLPIESADPQDGYYVVRGFIGNEVA